MPNPARPWCGYCRDSVEVIHRDGYRIPACESCWRTIDKAHERDRVARETAKATARALHPAGKDVFTILREQREHDEDPDHVYERERDAEVIRGVFS